MKSIARLILFCLSLSACASVPKLDPAGVRESGPTLAREFPNGKPVIAHYQSGAYELFYLAAAHTSDFGSPTLNLTEELFRRFRFNVLLIEPLPYSVGESPKWFVEEAKKGRKEKYIVGGESSLAVLLADERHIPFFAGEPDHREIYRGLKARGFSDEDAVAFYFVRQIPEWIRDKEAPEGLLERKAEKFNRTSCQMFEITRCPTLSEIATWYLKYVGRPLGPGVLNDEVAPIAGSSQRAQQISSEIAKIRDHFTLDVIEKLLAKYKKVAVIYGGGHFLTLRKSFDAALGNPEFVTDPSGLH